MWSASRGLPKPLLFNMCFNTFIQFVKQEKYNQLGFSPHDETDCLFHPVHWFQFADDAAVITTNERENQLLLNCFSRWCQWACMLIRVEKCITFGIKKFSTFSLQFQSKLFINSKIVPPVRNGSPSNTLDSSSTLTWITRIIRKFLSPPFKLC